MKLLAAGLLAILMTMMPAYGQEPPRSGGGQAERGEEQERPGTPHGPGGAQERMRQHERLSPEERRQLRRDVFKHGRDVYRERHDERRSGKWQR